MSKLALSDNITLLPELERILSLPQEQVNQIILHPNKAIWLSYCLDQIFPGTAEHDPDGQPVVRIFIRGATKVMFCPCTMNLNLPNLLDWSDRTIAQKYMKLFLWPYLTDLLFIGTAGCPATNVADYQRFAAGLSNLICPRIRNVTIRGIRCFNIGPAFRSWSYAAVGKRAVQEPILSLTNISFDHRKETNLKDHLVFRYYLLNEMAPQTSFNLLNLQGIEKSHIQELSMIGYEINAAEMSNIYENVSTNDWQHLTLLDLSHNSLSTQVFIRLIRTDSFRNLKILNLSHNHISCARPRAEWAGDSEMKEYEVILDTGSRGLWTKHLSILNLTENALTNSGLVLILSVFENLRELNCSRNFVTDGCLPELFSTKPFTHRSLCQLYLNHNQISEADLDKVLSLLVRDFSATDSIMKLTIFLKDNMILRESASKGLLVDNLSQYGITLVL